MAVTKNDLVRAYYQRLYKVAEEAVDGWLSARFDPKESPRVEITYSELQNRLMANQDLPIEVIGHIYETYGANGWLVTHEVGDRLVFS